MTVNRLLLLVLAWCVLGATADRWLHDAEAITPIRRIAWPQQTPSPSPTPRPTSTVLNGTSGCGNTLRYFGANTTCSTTFNNYVTVASDTTIKRIVCNQTADATCQLTFNVTHTFGTEDGNTCVSTNQVACDTTLSSPISIIAGVGGVYGIRVQDTGANCTNTIAANCTVFITNP